MKNPKSHFPVFRGSEPDSITVCAYCPRCDAVIKEYGQSKCDKCGFEIHWLSLSKSEEKNDAV